MTITDVRQGDHGVEVFYTVSPGADMPWPPVVSWHASALLHNGEFVEDIGGAYGPDPGGSFIEGSLMLPCRIEDASRIRISPIFDLTNLWHTDRVVEIVIGGAGGT